MRVLLLVLSVAVVGYALLAAAVASMQGRLLYPSAGEGGAATADLAARGLDAFPSEAAPTAFVAEPRGEVRGTVVLFHGNGGTAVDRGYYVDALGDRGLRVVLAEYPGYGGRPGTPSEAVLVADAVETIRAVRQRHGGPLVVWGESLGAGVAAAAAAQAGEAVDGVVLLTPWDSLLETARASFGWLPLRLLLRDRYESVDNLSRFEGPVAIVVAERDEVIPPARGLALFEGLDAPKRLWTFPGAGHNSWPVASGETWWDEVLAFVTPRLDASALR